MDVFFARFSASDETRFDKMTRLLASAGATGVVSDGDFVAIKAHVGEKGNVTHLEPALLASVARSVRAAGGKPFVTDTCVLYKSERSNAIDHTMLAHAHGFTPEALGCPFLVADGLLGRDERPIKIQGNHYQEVQLASLLFDVSAVVVVSHFTGHIAAGFGATLKNLGMGFASRKGKLNQHCDVAPFVKNKLCRKCGLCAGNCPADAVEMRDDGAFIDANACIGCGECLTVCRFDAVGFNWSVASTLLQEKIAEHALGVHEAKKGKIVYVNVLTNITAGCDCMAGAQATVVPDLGALCSFDPVALDQASYDLVRQATGRTIEEIAQPELDGTTQMSYAAKLGLGSLKYRLVEVD